MAEPSPIAIALTIAGSDSSGGAGIQADLKTFTVLGVYGASVITALTAQNTQGVQAVHVVPPDFISAQIASVAADLDIGAIKTGMLGERAVVEAVAARLAEMKRTPLVVDPVMIATSGDALLAPDAIDSVRRLMLPLASVVTPNLAEAAALLGTAVATTEEEQVGQAQSLLGLGAKAVLIKGGHGTGADAVDFLVSGEEVLRFAMPRLPTRNTHGTGCTLSAAIAASLAKGAALPDAVALAKDFVWHAIASASRGSVGHGAGPVDHLHGRRDGT